jgi:hypothetical protein
MNRLLITLVLACYAAFLATTAASAQTKQSGTLHCDNPDPQLSIPVGDNPSHSVGVQQSNCTWTKPLEMAGVKSKDGRSTATVEIDGSSVRGHGFFVGTMDSGDKFFLKYSATGTIEEGAGTSSKGSWEYTGGTGKLVGLTGKGTYTCDPSGSCEISGVYQLPK